MASRAGKPSNREKLLSAGLRVVLEQGYCGASVRDVVQAADVPQGSFTHYFRSKEAFGLEVLDLYVERIRGEREKTLMNEALPPFDRMRAWIDVQVAFLQKSKMRTGCMIGNLSIETGDASPAMRERLREIFEEHGAAVQACLEAAVKAKALPKSTDCKELSRFIFASLQGAILQAKVEQDAEPVERFSRFLFASLLR